jgi:hypothetical protein
MTREQAQALAEELVLRLARDSFDRRRWSLDQIGATFCGGIRALHGVVEARGEIKSNSVVMIAACAIELLREAFVQTGDSAEEIRAAHPLASKEPAS